MQSWQLQEAKARMSELVKKARQQPQEITLHGKSVAVVLSREDFDRLSQGQNSLVDFMRKSPLYDADDLSFKRDKTPVRDIDL